MTLLILGLLLWSLAHLFKRLMPSVREGMGEKGKGLVAIGSLAGIVLMVIGYRAAEGPVFWDRSPMLVGINNLLMLLSVYLFAASGMKLGIARLMRHPMLAGVGLWSLGHLLVNGDLESIVLFGGLWVWAIASMKMINAAQPDRERPATKPMKKEVIGVVATAVTYAVIAGAHYALGLPTFG